MEFNLSKCEILRITNKKNPIVFNYCIEAVLFVQVAHTKYLGVAISSNLSWNEHVQKITSKATVTYVNVLLTLNVTLLNISKLESIQRTAARFCFNDFQGMQVLLISGAEEVVDIRGGGWTDPDLWK